MASTQERLIGAAPSSGKVLYIGHELRHSTQWGRMREMIEEGVIGAAQYATIDCVTVRCAPDSKLTIAGRVPRA